MSIANQQKFGLRVTELRKSRGLTQKQLADQLRVSVTSVQNYESGRIPNGEILVRLAELLGCSPKWLIAGGDPGEVNEGGPFVITRGALPVPEMIGDSGVATRGDEPVASIYNDSEGEDFDLAEVLAQTLDILKSKTVYTTAIVSNIKAFHKAITTEKKIDEMQGQLNQALSSFQDQLDKTNQLVQGLQSENAQLRHDLEESRAASAVQDTG